jgi:type IV pilus assembly protein PilW
MKRSKSSPKRVVDGPSQQSGLSLVELMVAITIGMLVVAALLALYLNITRTNNEMAKANRQIENGRFAIQILQNDLSHAGFWGELDYSIAPAPSYAIPTGIPDPCDPDMGAWTSAEKDNLLAIPVQGYDGALAACGVTGVLPSSNVLVVRHANTCANGSACDGGLDTGPHIQVSNCRTDAVPEALYVIESSPASSAFSLRNKSCLATDTAVRRKIVTNIYYLATSNGLPTLMRVALVNGAYTTPQPLIEGIEAFQVEYGIDADGNGSTDSYVSCAPCNLIQLANVVSVKIHLLARNLEATPGYTDTKAYQLGAAPFAVPAADVGFKRHVFTTTIRLVNPSSRREVP